jgi:tetratricopeptide (TPR) repeat protein
MQVEFLVHRPNDPGRLEALGNTLNALGTVWIKKQDYVAARRDYGEAIEVRKRLVAVDPAKSEYQRVLANTYMNIGTAEYNAAVVAQDDAEFGRRLDDAREQFFIAQSIRRTALQQADHDPKLRRDLGKGEFSLGKLELAAQNGAKAIAYFQAAVAVFERLTEEQTADLDNQYFMAISYRLLGDVLSDDQANERRRLYQAALDRLQPLAQQNPDVVAYQADQASLQMNLFGLELQAGDFAAARAALRIDPMTVF